MKIGLLAMSGVRCRNEELLALGLTLPGFVERSEVIASLPSLGLLTLAGLTPAPHEQVYVGVEALDPDGGVPGDFDLVAISTFSAQIFEAYELADRYRARGVRVVMGGLHVTACPEEALEHCDAIALGEGEVVWPRIVSDADQGRLQRVYDARGQSFSLATAPMPRFDLLDPQDYNRFTVQTQRGCPFDCKFCAASIRLSPGYKVKPVGRVVEEIRRIRAHAGFPFIEFADDNTFVDKRRSRELVRALIPERIRWFTESDLSVADDPELLQLLRRSGCAQILIGLESPQAAVLSGLEQKTDWKHRRRDRYLGAIERIQATGITVNGCFILGLDGSDADSFDAVAEFVEESGLYEVQITVLTPFPGTPLYRELAAAGRLTHPGQWDRCTLFDVNFVPERMSAEELERGFRDLAQRLYSEKATTGRRAAFQAQVRECVRAELQTGDFGR